MNKSRVEAFSDGVFAIAITLLVLTIAQPTDYKELASQLASRWPSLAAYVVSFLVIGIEWVNHHAVFTHLQRLDRGMFYCNLLLLMSIVFIPYPTEVFGEALRQGHGARTAAVFYSATMFVNACTWSVLWLYASVGRRLLSPDFPESQRATSTILFTAGTGAYLVSIGVALIFSPYVCLAFHGALAVYYAFDPISRRVERERSPQP
ncbi:MAG TPA: TMEM175 family protein [Acidimicrobiales bacterium]